MSHFGTCSLESLFVKHNAYSLPDPNPSITLGLRSQSQDLAYNSLVDVTSTVDDIRSYLWKATAAVVPLVYSAGIQNNILEAMSTGTPVTTTSNALSSLLALCPAGS